MLSEALEQWLIVNYQISENYKNHAITYMNRFIEYTGNIPLNTLSKNKIITYIMSLRKKKYTNTYISIQMRTIKAIISWSVANGFVERNPFNKLVLPKAAEKYEYLSYEEITKLLTVAEKKPLYKAYIEFLLRTGCRVGELENLKWSDINGSIIEFNGKTGYRKFPLQDGTKAILDSIRESNRMNCEYVVFNPLSGKQLTSHRILSQIVKRYMRMAGLKESYTAHTLRHTFASHLVMNGIPIYTVSKLLGHRNVRTTERYSHLAPELLRVEMKYF